MPDLDLIKQEEQGVRDRRGQFMRGRSGNPAGRLLLAGEGEALTRKAVEMALAGDPTAMRLCLERIVGPYRERAVEFTCRRSATPRTSRVRWPRSPVRRRRVP
jgi:hypothetical protein